MVIKKEVTKETQRLTDFSTRICEEEPVIRKVAPKPSGFTSFDEDLEEEIDTTNLTECILEEYHAYLDIFSK